MLFTDYKKADLDGRKSMVKPSWWILVLAQNLWLQICKRKVVIENLEIAKSLTEAIMFIVTVLKKLFDKSPDPNAIVSEKSDVLQKPKQLNRLLTHLVKLKILSCA